MQLENYFPKPLPNELFQIAVVRVRDVNMNEIPVEQQKPIMITASNFIIGAVNMGMNEFDFTVSSGNAIMMGSKTDAVLTCLAWLYWLSKYVSQMISIPETIGSDLLSSMLVNCRTVTEHLQPFIQKHYQRLNGLFYQGPGKKAKLSGMPSEYTHFSNN